jgi:hypothetical protein
VNLPLGLVILLALHEQLEELTENILPIIYEQIFEIIVDR